MMQVESKLIHSKPDFQLHSNYVNPPIYRGSTVLYKSVDELEKSNRDTLKQQLLNYGRFGYPSTKEFEYQMTQLEGGFDSVCTGSGLSAISTSIWSFVESQDHILVCDSVYYPTKRFCESLKKFGIEVEFFEAQTGSEISKLIKANTKLVFMESPASANFRLQNVKEIAEVCNQKKIVSMIDNTWASPLFFKPLNLGVNVSIHSATKYITGHSDSFLGVVVCDQLSYPKIRAGAINWGQNASGDDVHLALRGLKTLPLRMQQHYHQTYSFALWLESFSVVQEVNYPALKSHPDHNLWRENFSGAGSVFSIKFIEELPAENFRQMLNQFKIFGLGYSYGGFESLVVPIMGQKHQIRLHIGFENISDLKMDFIQAFEAVFGKMK